ncbi:unnamed protein product [marine sediment metagenome]|uniref:RNA polymerase sigma-70 region 4 domain-containing protein n=1 Tax=marine sediment metagenome TaxID=412755 RepID=X1F1J9_9ZZZZ
MPKNPGEKILSDLYNIKNKTLQQIADIYDVTRECVRQWMEECRLVRRKRGRRNSFDESNLKEMYHEYAGGEPVTKLLKKYRISSGTFYKLLFGPEKTRFKGKPKIKNISFRLSRKEFDSIKFWSNKLGISKSRFFRIAIRRYYDWYNSLSKEKKRKCTEKIQ